MKKKIIAGLASLAIMYVIVAAFGSTSASASSAVVSYDMSAWNTSDTRTAGHLKIVPEGLHVWTDDSSSQAKVAAYRAPVEGTNLSNIGTPAVNWTGTDPRPGLQIVLDIPGGTGADGILVGEPTYGDVWWLSNGSSQELKDKAPNHGGGQGSDNWGTLAEWNAALEGQGWVSAIGFSLGSGVKGDGIIKSLTFRGIKYTFCPKPVETASPTPTVTASPTPTETSSPTPTATASPTPTATASPTVKPTPTQTTAEPTPTLPAGPGDTSTSPVAGVGGGDNGGLPLTGGKPLVIGGLGVVVFAVGAALAYLGKRRRDEDNQEYAS